MNRDWSLTMKVSAIVLAAGRSVRMGQPKMLMPWGETTVLGKVIQTVQAAGIEDIILVTNSEIAQQIANYKLQVILNDSGEMLSSIQAGLQALLPPPSLRDASGEDGRRRRRRRRSFVSATSPRSRKEACGSSAKRFRGKNPGSGWSCRVITCGADIPGWRRGNFGMKSCTCASLQPCAIF
ncbi:MAG: NTP transferase domain-containing protein [Chloroflexi bacterium]|nr:NTP transferase domain-containing protein [Chloroflexota bacterium]